MSRLLEPIHRALQLFTRQHQQVDHVADDAEGARDRERDVVDRVLDTEVGLGLTGDVLVRLARHQQGVVGKVVRATHGGGSGGGGVDSMG